LLSVIHRGLLLIAFACCALVVASFGMFARDQLAGASIHQQNELNHGGVTQQGAPPAAHHGQPRRFIDGAARALTSPFRAIVERSSSQWVLHGVPALLALLVYGVGLGYLARFSSGMARGAPVRRGALRSR
jgi:hypothetical protein